MVICCPILIGLSCLNWAGTIISYLVQSLSWLDGSPREACGAKTQKNNKCSRYVQAFRDQGSHDWLVH